MNRLLHAGALPFAIIGMLMMLAAGGGYVLASDSATIKACIQKGIRRLYKAPRHNGDKKLNWNEVGPPSPPGATGAT
jgi:hypothetical protein